MTKQKAVVILSGGLDSSTLLYKVIKDYGYESYALSFDYGQRHNRELDSARRIAKLAGAKDHKIVKVELSKFGSSALTDSKIEVPKARSDEEITKGIPITYVLGRNTVFLALALSYAESLDASKVFYGANFVDYSGYPDCRPEYVDAFNRLAALANKRGVEGRPIVIEAPLIYLSKVEIVREAYRLGVPINETWSCYSGLDEPCHVCESCKFRDNAIQIVNKELKEKGLPLIKI